MREQRVTLGLIGAGGIAQAYAQIARNAQAFRVVGVADPRRDAARALAEPLDCPAFASHEKLFEETGCEAAVVCTPPVTHPAIVCSLLARRVAVLCEKPLAIDPVSARAMLIEAERAGVPFTMASKFRYAEDVVRAKSIVESGTVGDVILFENTFASRVDMSRRWNSDPAVSGGGVLIDNGTHSVDILRFLLGPLTAVSAVSGRPVQNLRVEDTVRLSALTATGVLAGIDLSWGLNKECDSYIDLYGTAGTLHVGWRESRYRTTSSSDWVRFGTGYDKLDSLRREVENFCGAIRGREALRITADDALASTLAIEAAYESLRSGQWVGIPS